MDKTFTISAPVGGSFSVTIADSTGATVYTGTESNTPFTVTDLDAGDYILYAEVNGVQNGWCFNVPDCLCPVFSEAHLEVSAGIEYLFISFDFTDGFPCPFILKVATSFTSAAININSLADFTYNVGSVYTKKIMVGGIVPVTFYFIKTNGDVCRDPETISYTPECDGPTLQPVAGSRYVVIANAYDLAFSCSFIGDSCHKFTINYTQTNVGYTSGIGDSGSSAPTMTTTGTFTIPIAPNLSFPAYVNTASIHYHIQVYSCCGSSVPVLDVFI